MDFAPSDTSQNGRDNMSRMTSIFTSAALIGFAATAAVAEYPERPINMVIPYGAGGATDISARSIASPLGDAVGKPLVMSNVTGAGGATGAARGPPPRAQAQGRSGRGGGRGGRRA